MQIISINTTKIIDSDNAKLFVEGTAFIDGTASSYYSGGEFNDILVNINEIELNSNVFKYGYESFNDIDTEYFENLGGYEFKSNYKIVAVSDGDLVLHAIADAILGACQGGDIGIAFPDTDIKCKKIFLINNLEISFTI